MLVIVNWNIKLRLNLLPVLRENELNYNSFSLRS